MRRIKLVGKGGDVGIGDVILGTRWSDGYPNDPWRVGVLNEVKFDSIGLCFFVKVSDGASECFRYGWLLSENEAQKILAAKNPRVCRSNGHPKKSFRE